MKRHLAPWSTRLTPAHERSVILVDVQNIAGRFLLTPLDVAKIRTLVRAGAAGPTSHTIVACDRKNAAAVAFGWPDARTLIGHGKSAAALQLLDAIEHEPIEQRYSHIIIASGDGTFAPTATRLAVAGVRVGLRRYVGGVRKRPR